MASRFAVATGNWDNTATWAATDGGTPGASFPVDGDTVSLTATSGNITVTVNVSSAATSITCTGFTGTFTGSSALQLKGNLLAVAGMTYSYTGTLTIANTTGTATLTSAGKTLCGNLTQNGAGGTLTFADAFTVGSGTITVTAGSLTDGNVSLTMGAFSSPSGNGTVNWGTSNTWHISGSGTCWNTNIASNFGATASILDFNYSGASARTLISVNHWLPNIKISAGSGTVLFDKGSGVYGAAVTGLDFTGYSGTATFNGTNADSGMLWLQGDLILSGTATYAYSGSGAVTIMPGYADAWSDITSNGATFPTTTFQFLGGDPGNMRFLDHFITTGKLLHTSGSIYGNDKNLTFSAVDANTSVSNRWIHYGNGIWYITGTGTVWTSGGTGFWSDADSAFPTCVIDFNNSSGSARTAMSYDHWLPAVKVSAGSGTFLFDRGPGSYGCATLGLDFTGYSGAATFNGTNATAGMMWLQGDLTLSSSATYAYTGGTGGISFNPRAGHTTCQITSNGVSLSCTSFNLASARNVSTDSVKLMDHLNIPAALLNQLGSCTLDANNKNVTCSLFESSNTSTRTVTMGSGTWTITGVASGATYIWNTLDWTNLTLDYGTSTINCTYSGASERWFVSNGVPINHLSISAGNGRVALYYVRCNFLNFTGFTGTYVAAAGGWNDIAVRGSLTLGTGMTVEQDASWGSDGFITMSATSGSWNVTSNGVTLRRMIVFNGVGGTWTLQDDLISGTSTDNYSWYLQGGTFNANGHNVKAARFTLDTGGTRTLNMGSGTWTLQGDGSANAFGSVAFLATGATGLTLNANTSTLVQSYSASVTTTTISSSGFPINNLSFTSNTTPITMTGVDCKNLSFSGTGVCANSTTTVRGNITLSATGTYTAGANAWTWANTSGTVTFTSNGKTVDWPITMNGIGGTHQLADTFSYGATRTLTLTRGTFDSNGKTVTSVLAVLMNGTAGTTTLTSGISTWACNLTVNGVGGTLSFGDAFTTGSTKTVTLTAGTFNDNSKNLSIGLWDATGLGTRSVTYGTGNTWFITGIGVCFQQDGSNYTNNVVVSFPTCSVNFTNASASSRTIRTLQTVTAYYIPHCKISAGSGDLLFDGTDFSCTVTGLDFTGYSGACTFNGTQKAAIVNRGDLVLSAAATYVNLNNSIFSVLGGTVTPITITTNGKTIPCTELRLSDWLVLNDDLGTTGLITHYDNIFNANDKNVTCFGFQNEITSAFTKGAGAWSLTGTGIIWSLQSSPFTDLGSTTCTDGTSTPKTFRTGGKTYNTIQVKKSGANVFHFEGGGTFNLQMVA